MRLQQFGKKQSQIRRKIGNSSAHEQIAAGKIPQNGIRSAVKLPPVLFFCEQKVIAKKHFGKTEAAAFRILRCVVDIVIELKPFVVEKAIVDLLGRFGQPRSGIAVVLSVLFVHTVFHPIKRQVNRSELLTAQGEGRKELIVQIGKLFTIRAVYARNIQCVTVGAQAFQIFFKGQPVFRHPTASLELAPRQNHTDAFNGMFHTPQIRDFCDGCLTEQSVKVHLMHHALDIRHADLEGGMDMLSAVQPINLFRKRRGKNPFTVKQRDRDITLFLHSLVVANIADTCPILHGDDIHIRIDSRRIVDDNDRILVPQHIRFYACSARKQQTVIGVELGQLANAKCHADRHPAGKLLIYIRANKRKHSAAAHAARAFKGEIACVSLTEVQCNPLRGKHGFGLFLHERRFRVIRIPIKYSFEVKVEYYIRKIGDQRVRGGLSVLLPTEDAHSLKENGIVFLPCLAVSHDDFLGLRRRQCERIGALIDWFGIGQHRLHRQPSYKVSEFRHGNLRNCFFIVYHRLPRKSIRIFITTPISIKSNRKDV